MRLCKKFVIMITVLFLMSLAVPSMLLAEEPEWRQEHPPQGLPLRQVLQLQLVLLRVLVRLRVPESLLEPQPLPGLEPGRLQLVLL